MKIIFYSILFSFTFFSCNSLRKENSIYRVWSVSDAYGVTYEDFRDTVTNANCDIFRKICFTDTMLDSLLNGKYKNEGIIINDTVFIKINGISNIEINGTIYKAAKIIYTKDRHSIDQEHRHIIVYGIGIFVETDGDDKKNYTLKKNMNSKEFQNIDIGEISRRLLRDTLLFPRPPTFNIR
jgi:hypothetical protein